MYHTDKLKEQKNQSDHQNTCLKIFDKIQHPFISLKRILSKVSIAKKFCKLAKALETIQSKHHT